MNGGAYRQSMQIGRKPAANLHHATRLAIKLGLPLNRFVTINYSKTACVPRDASARFRLLLASWFARWLRRHPKNRKACPPTYVWVFEAGGDQTAVHWLIHIPRGLIREFGRALLTWLEITAGPIEGGVVRHKRIYNVVGLKRYVLKGMDPHFATKWEIRHIPQGVVIGKRSGTSRNLGPTARRATNYQPRRFSVRGWEPVAHSTF